MNKGQPLFPVALLNKHSSVLTGTDRTICEPGRRAAIGRKGQDEQTANKQFLQQKHN